MSLFIPPNNWLVGRFQFELSWLAVTGEKLAIALAPFGFCH